MAEEKIRKVFKEIVSEAIYSDENLLKVFRKYRFTSEDHEKLAALLHKFEEQDFELSDLRADDLENRVIEGERFDE